MSIHRSLKSADTMKRHRSVLSRRERTLILQEKGSLDLESSSVLGLPKVKHLKMRIRKEKAAAATAEGGAAEGTVAAGTAAASGAGAAAAGASSKAAPAKAAAASSAAKPKK